LWVIGTNGAHSWIDKSAFAEAMSRLEFLVVQDMYTTTETARMAHLVLPAAGWGEKEGTFINSERRFGVVRKVARAPGQALSDFAIFRLLAEAWGCGGMFDAWRTPEDAFAILKELSRDQPCDFTGIRDYAHIEAEGGIQWPLPLKRPGATGALTATGSKDSFIRPGRERRLFEDRKFHTPDGRARFHHEEPVDAPEGADSDFPFILITGRGTSAQWHTQTRTGKSAILRQLHPAECYVEIHPRDAGALGIRAQSRVSVESRRGSLVATAFVTGTLQPGHVFIPMHYPEVNRLTLPVFDPYSRQPSFKHCAVRVRPIAPDKAPRPVTSARQGHRGPGMNSSSPATNPKSWPPLSS
jgi:assimilatory nitrate reductase catalytic subunit